MAWGLTVLSESMLACSSVSSNEFNTLQHKQNGQEFADNIFRFIFLYEKWKRCTCILIKIWNISCPISTLSTDTYLLECWLYLRLAHQPALLSWQCIKPRDLSAIRGKCIKIITGLGSIPFFQFNSNSNSFTFNSNSNSFGMKNSNSNSNSNSFLSIPIPIPIPFYQFLFNSFLNPN